MSFQSRDLQDCDLLDKNGTFLYHNFQFGQCVHFQLAAKLSNQ